MKYVVKCRICGRKFTGKGANEHRETTGHNSWDLLLKKKED